MGGNRSARPAGKNNLEDFRRIGQIFEKGKTGSAGGRLGGSQVGQNIINIFACGRHGRLESHGTKHQHGVELVEMPSHAGAQGDAAIKSLCERGGRRG